MFIFIGGSTSSLLVVTGIDSEWLNSYWIYKEDKKTLQGFKSSCRKIILAFVNIILVLLLKQFMEGSVVVYLIWVHILSGNELFE